MIIMNCCARDLGEKKTVQPTSKVWVDDHNAAIVIASGPFRVWKRKSKKSNKKKKETVGIFCVCVRKGLARGKTKKALLMSCWDAWMQSWHNLYKLHRI